MRTEPTAEDSLVEMRALSKLGTAMNAGDDEDNSDDSEQLDEGKALLRLHKTFLSDGRGDAAQWSEKPHP